MMEEADSKIVLESKAVDFKLYEILKGINL